MHKIILVSIIQTALFSTLAVDAALPETPPRPKKKPECPNAPKRPKCDKRSPSKGRETASVARQLFK